MNRKEYLAARLRHDFIRYVLLTKPRLSDAEVSRRLRSKIDADSLYQKLKEHIPVVINQFLSPEKLIDAAGKPVAVLPEWLTPAIADKVAAEYCAKVESEYSAVNFLPDILAQIERLTWVQGVDDMAVNLRRFTADLADMEAHYANIPDCKPNHYEIDEKFAAAKRITIGEHVMQSNHRDIADFHAAMTAYCTDLCAAQIARVLSKLYADLAASPTLLNIIDKFARLHREAEAELHTLPTDIAAEWDDEYNRLVPVPFFENNIEDIDAPKAFQAIFITALAHHETILRSQGALSPTGELTLFTSYFPLLTTDLFSTIIS